MFQIVKSFYFQGAFKSPLISFLLQFHKQPKKEAL